MDKDAVLEALRKGEAKLYALDREHGSADATSLRRSFLEDYSQTTLSNIAHTSLDFDVLCGRNAENTIGAAQIPMGVAGPLKVRGTHASGTYYVPLATTEGALIASTNRGCSVITQAGGAVTTVLGDVMTRAPLFRVPDLTHATELVAWADEHFDKLQEVANAQTRYTKLVECMPFVAGRNVFLRFAFSTGDSMAMNSATKASDAVATMIEETFPWAELVSVSGNMCVDKKPSAVNFVLGRGKSVAAEVLIPKGIVEKKLKTTAARMADVCYRKIYVGSARAGSVGGFNAHFANVAAAFFAATGQDLAHVVEAATGLTMMEDVDGDLYACVTLPDVPLATFGAGTQLPTQKEALSILGLVGSSDVPGERCKALAEVFASTVLAGELSLIGALASRDLTKAHMQYGRARR
ncbi:MAG TPA: hydroxymethylglutaryl-CoA reductase (NADPH) [Methanomicrobia archaeon]|nr:hydroxymethylglutaryl-CoA reductase (NADPH) [Methanomicrobia archaeon]